MSSGDNPVFPIELGPPYRLGGETVTSWKKRRRAQREHVRGISDQVLTDVGADAAWERLALQSAKDVSALRSQVGAPRAMPTGLRAEKSAAVKTYGHGVRMSAELPAGIRQLLTKGTLTPEEGILAGRFRGDYDLAFYSTPGMVTNYEQEASSSGSSGGVACARAAVVDARGRIRDIEGAMTGSCWAVLTGMVVFDLAQVKVGEEVSRYKCPKARRLTAGVLLFEALDALKKIYG